LLSLVLILYVPSLAALFKTSPLSGAQASIAAAIGIAAVAWRLLER
jgi:hypothetical protein